MSAGGVERGLDAVRDRLLERAATFTEAPGQADEPSWLADLRSDARACFRENGLPTTRLEEWRYTSLAPLTELDLEPAAADVPAPTPEAIEASAFPLFACSSFVFVNGRFHEELSTPPGLSGGAGVESLARLRRDDPAALRERLGRRVDLKQHPFAAVSTALLDDGAVLRLPAGVENAAPIHLIFISLPDPTGSADVLTHPRVLLDAPVGSRAVVIQDHVSLGDGAALTNSVTEVDVADGARLDLVLLQRESNTTLHVSGLHARVGRDARLDCHTLTLGGRLVRNDLSVLLAEEGAECNLNGLFLGAGQGLVDNHTLVDHAVPHGTSHELYKGILGGRSRGVFRGRVVVRPDAQRTDATQSNPNLLLTDSAEIDTKPQLEIYANDVKCSHGSAIGQVDADALFYLRSRGIGESRARDLLTRGFAHEVTERLPSQPLAERVDELLLARLAEAGGPG